MDRLIYDINLHLTYRIARLQARLSAQAADILRTHSNISLSEWRIIAVLSDDNINSQKDVLRAMGLDKGQISRNLKSLASMNLISLSTSDTDQRLQNISLTPQGHKLVAQLSPIMLTRQKHLQQDFNEDDLTLLFDLLSRLEQRTGSIEELSERK